MRDVYFAGQDVGVAEEKFQTVSLSNTKLNRNESEDLAEAQLNKEKEKEKAIAQAISALKIARKPCR